MRPKKLRGGPSPLLLGLLHLLPSALLILALIWALQSLVSMQKDQGGKTLGAETRVQIETVTREERINKLEEELKKTDSQAVRDELLRLEQ